jgi:hypothetical protein
MGASLLLNIFYLSHDVQIKKMSIIEKVAEVAIAKSVLLP